jgi:hypothetical protein
VLALRCAPGVFTARVARETGGPVPL